MNKFDDIVGNTYSFLELDNEMIAHGFCSILDEVSDFDELYECETVIYTDLSWASCVIIKFIGVSKSEDISCNNIIKVISIERS